MLCDFQAAWLLLIPGFLVLLSLPLIFWRRRRLAYLSALCAIVWLALLAALVRNWRAYELLTVIQATEGLPKWDEYHARIGIAASCLSLHVAIWHGPYDDAIPTTVSHQGRLYWNRALASPDASPIAWWFYAHSFSQISGPYERAEADLILPAWFVSLLLLPLPTWRILTRNRRLRAARAQVNLCTHCAYSLHAHSPGQRCPECGTPIP
jgi:hypothetical protein